MSDEIPEFFQVIKGGNLDEISNYVENQEDTFDINVTDNINNHNCLFYAIICFKDDDERCLRIIQHLIPLGADPFLNDFDGMTILFFTSSFGLKKCTEFLLSIGDNDVSHVDYSGKTALFYSVAFNQIETTKILLENNFDIDHLDNSHKSCIYEIRSDEYVEIALLLKEKKIKSYQQFADNAFLRGWFNLYEALLQCENQNEGNTEETEKLSSMFLISEPGIPIENYDELYQEIKKNKHLTSEEKAGLAHELFPEGYFKAKENFADFDGEIDKNSKGLPNNSRKSKDIDDKESKSSMKNKRNNNQKKNKKPRKCNESKKDKKTNSKKKQLNSSLDKFLSRNNSKKKIISNDDIYFDSSDSDEINATSNHCNANHKEPNHGQEVRVNAIGQIIVNSDGFPRVNAIGQIIDSVNENDQSQAMGNRDDQTNEQNDREGKDDKDDSNSSVIDINK